MSRYEIAISILNKDYVNDLIVALVRQGYSVYFNDDSDKVCFTTQEDEVTKLGS